MHCKCKKGSDWLKKWKLRAIFTCKSKVFCDWPIKTNGKQIKSKETKSVLLI